MKPHAGFGGELEDGTGRRTGIAARPHSQRWIGDDDGNIRAKALTERQRQRQPGKGAAADDNASLCRHAIPYPVTSSDYACYLILAGRNRAEKQG